MSWIYITVDTLNEAKIAALVEACSSEALATAQPDRAEGLIQGVVDLIRRKVAACPGNRVDSDAQKIPANLKSIAVTLIIAELKNAIEQPLTEDEVRAVAKCERELNRVAECKDPVDQPDDPITPEVQSGGAAKLLSDPNQHPFGQLGTS